MGYRIDASILSIITPLANPDEDARPALDNKKATGKEVVGTQTVKRGLSITIEEVPDKEDETVYQQWLAVQKANQRERDIQNDNDWVPTKRNTSALPCSRAWYKPFKID